jgi:hypothetical protein
MSASLDILKSLGARIVELEVPDPQTPFRSVECSHAG